MMTETVVTVQEVPQNNASKSDNQNNCLARLKPNVDHFKTIPGILKLVQLLLGILCMALASPAWLSSTHWFLFVTATSFVITLIWVFIYFLSVREAWKIPVNWLLTEFLNTIIITLLYTIAFIVQLSSVSGFSYFSFYGKYIAAGVFALFNTIAYGASVYYLYMDWKQSQAQ